MAVECDEVSGVPESYWGEIFTRATKNAARTLRLDSAPGIITLFTVPAATALGLFLFTSLNGAGIPVRIASVLVPIVLLPLYIFAWLPAVIAQVDAEKVAQIQVLKGRVTELEVEGQSDISIRLDLNAVVHSNVDWPNVMHEYRVVIENVGSNHLTNCVLRIGTVNRFNHYLADRTWLHDASSKFDMLRGDIKALTVLWTDAYDAEQPAYPHYHSENDDHAYPGNRGGEIIPSDQVYYLFIEVLSANTTPARLTVRVLSDEDEWQLEALEPSDKPTF